MRFYGLLACAGAEEREYLLCGAVWPQYAAVNGHVIALGIAPCVIRAFRVVRGALAIHLLNHRLGFGFRQIVLLHNALHTPIQRRGIATALYSALFDLLAYQGYYSIYVGVTCPNPRSMAFHMSMGFERMGAYHNSMYKFGKWRDVIWMGKSLRHHEGEPKPTLRYPDVKDDAYCRQVLEQAAQLVHESRAGKEYHA